MKFVTMEEILTLAIAFEEHSYLFYQKMMGKVLDETTRQTLEFLSREELDHKALLEDYLKGNLKAGAMDLKAVQDGKIVEAFPAGEVTEDLSHAGAFLVAAQREKMSHEFYTRLSEIHPAGPVKDLLARLAREELAHKEKAEYLYVNAAFPQTAGG
jgi:rubrerythrin